MFDIVSLLWMSIATTNRSWTMNLCKDFIDIHVIMICNIQCIILLAFKMGKMPVHLARLPFLGAREKLRNP